MKALGCKVLVTSGAFGSDPILTFPCEGKGHGCLGTTS
jgi:hypothetical protein